MTVSRPSASDSFHEITLPGSGSILGRYRVVRRLGAGGMGQVFAAASEGTDELVALKLITLTDPTLLVRFKQEFRSLADLTHPNLVRLGELFVLPNGLAFYTMELVEGQSLVRWVRRGTPAGTVPNIHRLCHALRQLATGVAHLHRVSLVHRDLKPSNVLVTEDGRVVILDFGLVLELGERDARITGTGQLVGTPAYMAPEQGTRDAVGPAVDLYALGVTMFECLTGCMPFAGSAMRVLVNKQTQPAPDPRELAEGVPDWAAQLCRGLLAVVSEQRPSAEQLIAVLDQHGPTTSTDIALQDNVGPQLIGRTRELELLWQAHEQTRREGVATCVRVTGPQGRGKSALLEHFLDDIRKSNSVILRGRCHPRESVPYKGIDRIIDELAVHLRAMAVVEAAAVRPRHVRELCELFPVLSGIWAETGRRGPAQDPIARRRLGVAALREALIRFADEATLVVVIDDFQWADLDGFDVLRELLLPPEPPALALVLAYDDAADGPIAKRVREVDVFPDLQLVDIELAPLTEADARALALTLIDGERVEGVELLAEQLARNSGGEPLALVRAATKRELVDEAELGNDEILRRIHALTHTARELLELAHIAETKLVEALAHRVLDCAVADLEAATRELVGAGLLHPAALDPGGGGIGLAHSRIGALLQVDSNPARQARLHVGLAEALAANEAEPELIAVHFESGGEFRRACDFMKRAASEANDALAFVRAERLYRRALELIQRSGIDEHETEALQLRLALADQLANLAHGREAGDLYIAVAERSPPEAAAKLRMRAAEQYTNAGWTQLALPLLRELFAAAGERLPSTKLGALWTYIAGRVRLALHGRKYRLRAPEDISADLLDRFDLLYTAHLALSRKDMLLSFALRPRAMLLGLMSGEVSRLIEVTVVESALLMTFGRSEQAAVLLTRAEEWGRDCNAPKARAQLHSAWHFYHVRLGQLEQAEARFESLMSCLEQHSGRGWLHGPAFQFQAVLLRQSGSYRRLIQAVPGWLSALHDFGQRQHAALIHVDEVLALAQLGQCEAARRSLERGRATWDVDFYSFPDYLLGMAETWLLLAEAEPAKARMFALQNEAELRRHGHGRFKIPSTRVIEARAWAQLIHAITVADIKLAPRPRELRRLRHCGMPQHAMTALILIAGRATLRGDRERALVAWRDAVRECEALSMHGFAAALRWRITTAEPDDELRGQAQAYFEAERIGDIARFVALMAPAHQVSG